jgi:hypothetical protein
MRQIWANLNYNLVVKKDKLHSFSTAIFEQLRGVGPTVGVFLLGAVTIFQIDFLDSN